MHSLLFVFTLLTVLGTAALANSYRARSRFQDYGRAQAQLKGYWEIYNGLQQRLFEKQGGEKEEEEPYFRVAWLGSKASRINLFFLLDASERESVLAEVTCRYLVRLYGSLFGEKESDRYKRCQKILNSLLDVQKKRWDKEKKLTPLCSIQLPKPDEDQLYRAMLCGLLPCDFTGKQGRAPLKEVILFDPKGKKKPSFRYASLTLLETILGEQVSTAIEKKEREMITDPVTREERVRNTPLSRQELKEILGELRIQVKEEKLALLATWTTRKEPPLFWVDERQQVSVKYFPDDKKEKKDVISH